MRLNQPKKEQNKCSQLKNYFQFTTQLKLYLDAEMVEVNKKFIPLIVFFSSLQRLSFVLDNYYQLHQGHKGFNNLINSLSNFTRPEQLFSKIFSNWSFMIPLLFILINEFLIICLFIQFIHQKRINRVQIYFKIQKRIIQLFFKFASHIYALLDIIIFIPFVEMAFYSIFYQSKYQFNLGGLILSSISLLLIIISNFTYQTCIKQSQNIKIKNFNHLQLSFNKFINPVLDLLIVLIDQIDIKNQAKFYLISAFILIYTLINLIIIFIKQSNIKRIALVNLAGLSFQFTTLIVLMILEIFQQSLEFKDYETVLILIVTPLICSLFQFIYVQLYFKILFKKLDTQSAAIQLYQIANILDEFDTVRNSYENDYQRIFQIIYFKQTHIQNCSQSNCICQKQNLNFEQILNLYLKDLANSFNQSINKIKLDDDKQQYFLFYLSFINQLGFNTRAFKQSNIVILEKKDSFIPSFSRVDEKRSQGMETVSAFEKQQSSFCDKTDNKMEIMIQIKYKKLNFIQKQRLFLISENIRSSMSNSLGNEKINNLFSDNLAHAVKLFLVSEESNKVLKNKIIKIINRKKIFFQQLIAQNSNFNLFEQAKILIYKMTQLEDQLFQLYTQFPSRKMQALNTFYLSEVMNNYFQAFKLATVTSISDEKLFKMQEQINFDLFSNKIDYLNVGFEEKSNRLVIKSSSNQIHKFFGISQESCKQIKYIDHYLPSNFESVHTKMVQLFLQTGVSRFFRQVNQNFCRFQYKFIKSMEIFYDVNLQNMDDLTFACFLSNKESQNSYLFIGNNNKILNISKNFINKVGYPSNLTSIMNEYLTKMSISKLFPKHFNSLELNLTKAISEQELGDQDLIADQSEYQILMQIPDVEQLSKSQTKKISDSDITFYQYSVDAIFHYRKLKANNINYTIIEIREAKKIINTLSTPLQTECITITPEVSNQNSFDKVDNNIDLDDEESLANQPKAIEFVKEKNDYKLEGYQYEQSEIEQRFGVQMNQNWKNQSQSFYPNSSLISPKDARLKLIEIQNEAKIQDEQELNFQKPQTVQQYFAAVDQKDAFSNEQENESSKINQESSKQMKQKIEQLQIDDIDKELQENIQLQMQLEEQEKNVVAIDDIGSQVSSVAAFKKSKYSKKYDLIQKLITTGKFSKYFYLTRSFLTLFLLLFIIFSVVEIFFSENDLNRFLQELDMIQIKSNILGPIDNYVVAQTTVINYAVLNMIGMMPLEISNRKLDYAMKDITYNYENLKISFIKQLQNKYLKPFFQNKNFTIVMSEQSTISTHVISAREAIYLLLEAAYQFVLVDYLNVFTSLDVTSGFFIYLFGNHETFTKQFSQVNQEILDYSIQRSIDVKQKWINLMLPILIIGFMLLLIVIKLHDYYLKQYDEFISLFSQIEIVWMQRDIDRYRGISSLVLKDSDVLFQYQFDIELKERFLAAEDIRKEKIAQNQKSHKQKEKQHLNALKQKSNKLPSIITYTTLFVLCFSLCFISTSLGSSYFNKYPSTTNYFNTLCEVSIASTGVFSCRQLCYAINDKVKNPFFFLTNLQFFKDTFFELIQTIDDFLSLMAKFESTNLLTSQQFEEKMQSLLSNDVCQFLPSYKIEGAQEHCDVLFGGVLRRGLTATLNTVRNSLLNEYQQSSNFSIQSYSLNEESETGLISYDAIQNVKTQFQEELIKFTQDLMLQILIINVCAFCFYIFVIIFMFIILTKIYYDEFRLVVKFVLLLPQTSLFLDNQLDRNLKQIIVKNNLI